ncbi:putative tricarboxylic transport membrane protein [Tistlia consotensis]|uniref:Putative tricarboxylic transport membrane protein n=1 Tax=Tistlia consotensis USBA 355 TaxID=560819 RepID=A0A1Y6CM22_9PROT|nr:tripartite tricarboxylate transporter TctB family protein [Tistlia consotensis]SMF73809.1 putative tricarboxylic transport membrane protein [Tistlia consotensis USBA 355]SNS28891.1 putative tricarboxylic transport membrane protein [Tistlia consotensis]
MSDRVLGGFCLALAAFFLWRTTKIETSFITDPLGPKAFPVIIAGVLGLAGLYVLARPDARPDWPGAGRLVEIALAVGVMVAYALLLPSLGFVAATALGAGYLCWRLGAGPLEAPLAGLVISLGIYAIFHLVLGLSLARGPWGF